MSREIGMLATTSLLLILAASVFGQEPQIQPTPTLPASILGPQMIVWSQAQKPQPVPQPLPPPDRPEQQAGQPANPPAQQQQPATQTFTGTVVKDDGRYLLKAATSTYQLDDQDTTKHYEGKQVKVAGTLDANGYSLHIISIELIS